MIGEMKKETSAGKIKRGRGIRRRSPIDVGGFRPGGGSGGRL